MDFLKWQIATLFYKKPIVNKWIDDSKFFAIRSEHGITGNIYTGLHEYQDMAYILHVLRGDSLFVDIGANVGSYTILASTVVGCKVYAFEPVLNTYEKLKNNISLNEANKKVHAFNMGLGNKESILTFTNNLNTKNRVVAKGNKSKFKNKETVDIRVDKLDNIIKNETPSLLKIDVEGYELFVLKGAQTLLRKDCLHSIIVEINGNVSNYGNYDENDIQDFLQSYGYRPYSYDPLTRSLMSLDGGNRYSKNTLFVKNIDFVKQKIESAPKFKVKNKLI